MMRTTVLSVVAAVALSVSPAGAERFHCDTVRGESPYANTATGLHDHLRYAPEATDEPVREFSAFAAAFDGPDDDNGDGRPDQTGNPSWVAYHLIGVGPNGDGRYVEPDVSVEAPRPWYRSVDLAHLWTDRPGISAARVDDSYSGVGRTWNRGHLAMADHAQRIGPEASCNTHVFWNASPQAADFNQGPWLHLETYTAALSNMDGEIWIVAGPVFDRRPLINIAAPGEVPVAVPHAFFKLIVREVGASIEVRALVFEHPSLGRHGYAEPEPGVARGWVNCRRASAAHHTYAPAGNLVSLAELERRTGLRFLRAHPDYARIASVRPQSLWDVPERYWSGFLCGGQNDGGPSND